MMLLSANWSHIWMVTILGFCLVFVLLVVLILIMKLLGNIMQEKPKKQASAVQNTAAAAPKREAVQESSDDAAVKAAIAMALHLFYNGVHDEEPTQVTLKKVERRYSPWNSKLYGINNLHR